MQRIEMREMGEWGEMLGSADKVGLLLTLRWGGRSH